MSTHNLCFRAKIRKNEYPCKPQFYYIKVGWKGCLLHGHVIMMPELILTKNFALARDIIHDHEFSYNAIILT